MIPAHDEETTVAAAVQSCNALDYPTDRFSTFVIADNCSDRTAEIARNAGASVLERSDTTAMGKGYALQWGFDQVLSGDYDALVVLDADCRMDSHGLRVLHEALARGETVIQCSYVVDNPDESVMSYVSAIGNSIENDLFYAPKSRLELAVILRGTGMVLHRDILHRFPWSAHSITEDIEYSLQLIQRGIRVKFVPQVRVLSSFPVSTDQLMIQRRRWAAGTAGVGKALALKLMLRGMLARDAQVFDAGWTILVLSRPLLIVLAILALITSISAWWLSPTIASTGLLVIAGIEIAALFSYFALGVYLLGMNRKRLILLSGAPLVVCRLIWASVQGLLGIDKNSWRRTPRQGEMFVSSR